jgi:hypothetical protein
MEPKSGVPLNSRKDRAVDAFALLVGGLIPGQDDATLRAPGLVSARSDKVRMRYGRWVNPRRHEPEYVSDVRKQDASAFLRNYSHARKIDLTRISAGAADNEIWFVFQRFGFDGIIVEKTAVSADVVRFNIAEQHARNMRLSAVAQVAPLIESHSKYLDILTSMKPTPEQARQHDQIRETA